MRCKPILVLLLLAAVLSGLSGCGGGSNPPAAKNITAPDLVLTAIDPRLVIADIPYGLHVDQVISFTLVSEDYFKQNPVGHFAIVTRSDLARLPTKVLGQGFAVGNLTGAIDGTKVNPGSQIETWCDLPGRDHYLLDSPPSPVWQDGIRYDVRIETHVSLGQQTVRYTLSVGGNQIYDSGVMDDPNRGFDPAMNGIAIGHVFDSADAGLWLIRLSNIRIELS